MVQARSAETQAPSSAKPGTVLAVTQSVEVAFSYVDAQGFVRVAFAKVYGKPGQEAVAVQNPDVIATNYVEPTPSIKEGILRRLGVPRAVDVKPEDLPDGIPGGEAAELG